MAATTNPPGRSQLNVVFDGTWVMVPAVDAARRIVGVDVYSPACGHPQGVLFTKGLDPSPSPGTAAFYMLDNHSHRLAIQRASGSRAGMAVSGIDTAVNHCLTTARPLGSNWDLLISIAAGPDAWTSGNGIAPTVTDSYGRNVPCFSGRDAPTGWVSSVQTLSFYGVAGVELCGAPGNVQALLPAPWSGDGSLVFEDEVPYVPTLQHERTAIAAMAALAGLDLALDTPLPRKPPVAPPSGGPLHPMTHTGGYCGHALIVLP